MPKHTKRKNDAPKKVLLNSAFSDLLAQKVDEVPRTSSEKTDSANLDVPPRKKNKKNRPDVRPCSINSGVADALADIPPIDIPANARVIPEKNEPVSEEIPFSPPPSIRHKSPPKPAVPLPSRMLRLEISETEHTKYYIQVEVRGNRYWYPIRSWLPVFEMCEAIYRQFNHPVMVRGMSRRAVTELVQSYCNRGPFDRIPRSQVERAVRNKLDRVFVRQLRIQSKSPTAKSKPRANVRSSRPSQSYEERIAAYRARHRNDGLSASEAAKRRVDAYIARKAKRISPNSPYIVPGEFTERSQTARTVWIGLDFGTQNAKVAFRDEDDQKTVLLEFDPQAKGIDRFLFSPSLDVQGDALVFSDKVSSGCPSWKHAISVYFGTSYTDSTADIDQWFDAVRQQSAACASRSSEDLVIIFASIHLSYPIESSSTASPPNCSL